MTKLALFSGNCNKFPFHYARKVGITFLFAVLVTLSAFAQQIEVRGKILEESSKASVIGATVRLKGQKAGVVSDINGGFSLKVKSLPVTLVVSSTGYKNEEIDVYETDPITINLAEDQNQLNEVVVVGYGTQKKSNITSSVVKVSGAKLEQIPISSVDQILQGKVAGLQSATFSGQPGANQQIRIRGVGSIYSNASSQPTYVIDGIIVNSGDLSRATTTSNVLAQLNPNDVESISVLKDAAATAIYGALGSNGVIVITTKSGKAGKTKFTFNAEVGYNTHGPIPSAGKTLRTNDWLTLFKESIVNAGYTQAQATAQAAKYGDGTVDTDWLSLITRKGQQRQYNFSASGGDEKTKFYVSAGYFKQESNVIGSDLKRISSVIKVDHNVNKKLSFALNLQPTYSRENAPTSNSSAFSNPVMEYYFLRPTQNPYNADGSLNIGKATKDFSSLFNPLYITANDKNYIDIFSINGKAEAKYNILSNLSFSSKLGLQYNNLEEYQYNNPNHGDGKSVNGSATSYYTRYFLYDWVNQFDYHADFTANKDLALDATAGYEALSSKQYNINAEANNYPTDKLISSYIASTPTAASATWSDYSFIYLFARANLSYKNKYFLSGSIRRDGSSRFSEDKRYGYFPSGSAGWDISKETFFKPIKFVNNFKVRASYGIVANANGLGNYDWRPQVGYGLSYNNQPGGNYNTLGAVDLKWESGKQTDFGLDASFLNNRVNIVFDWYNRITDNLIYKLPTSLSTGFDTKISNVGALQNKGIEFTINATPIKTKDFSWDISFNITHNKNSLTKNPLDVDQANGSFVLGKGHDFYEFYLKQWAGVDPANGNPLWYTDETKTATTNNYNSAAKVATGKSASPKYYGGFSNTFTYKGFSVSGDFYYNYGNYVQDQWAKYFNDEVNSSYGKYSANLDRWQKAGDVTNVPKLVYGSTNNSAAASTRFLYKGDYIRLRNVSVGYSFNPKVLSKINLSSLNLYVRGTNLFTHIYDKNIPFDPEQNISSQSNLNFFINKSVTVGINVGL
jgi:TonB-dependent starch-binding outer membrane protein SusC